MKRLGFILENGEEIVFDGRGCEVVVYWKVTETFGGDTSSDGVSLSIAVSIPEDAGFIRGTFCENTEDAIKRLFEYRDIVRVEVDDDVYMVEWSDSAEENLYQKNIVMSDGWGFIVEPRD